MFFFCFSFSSFFFFFFFSFLIEHQIETTAWNQTGDEVPSLVVMEVLSLVVPSLVVIGW